MRKQKRAVRISDDLRTRITELGWQKRIGMSAIVREEVTAFANGAPWSPPDTTGDDLRKFQFYIDDEVWDRAIKRAASLGTSLAEVMRVRLEERVQQLDKVGG